MDLHIKRKEQAKIDNTIDTIRINEKELYSKYEITGRDFYNVNLEFEERKKIQTENLSMSDDIKKINNIIKSPFIGKIKYVTVNGHEDEAYIGKIAYNKNGMFIHDWRSSFGKAFRSKKLFFENLNIETNRILNITNSTLENYFDCVSRNYIDKTVQKSSSFLELIEINKRKKDILTSINSIQNEIIDMPKNKNIVLHGVPGSGKTIIGGYRLSSLSYQLNTENSKNSKLIYLTRNNSLKAYSMLYFNKIDKTNIKFISYEDMFFLVQLN